MNVIDRAHLNRALLAYDFFLDLRGMSRRRRRDLRQELRANLHEAAADQSGRAAVRALGSLRVMAVEACSVDPHRPRWSAGAQAGVAAMAGTWLLTLLAAFVWMDGARTASPHQPVSGHLPFLPGSALTYHSVASGFVMDIDFGWTFLFIGVLTFVLVARPWRLFTRQSVMQGT